MSVASPRTDLVRFMLLDAVAFWLRETRILFYERMEQERSETFRPVNARIPPRSYAPSEGYFTGSLRGELGIRKLIFSNVVRFTATGVCTVNK